MQMLMVLNSFSHLGHFSAIFSSPSGMLTKCDKLSKIIFHSSTLSTFHLVFFTSWITYEIYSSFLWHMSVVSSLLLSPYLCISYHCCYYTALCSEEARREAVCFLNKPHDHASLKRNHNVQSSESLCQILVCILLDIMKQWKLVFFPSCI